MFRIIISTVLVGLFFLGCETKRQNFEPEKVAGSVRYDGTLPASISDVSRYGATLANGQIITKAGLGKVRLPEGYGLLGEFDERFIAASACGKLLVLDATGATVFEYTFEHTVASASVDNNTLAVVDASNRLSLIDMETRTVRYSHKQDNVYALDSRIAAPYFLSSLVLFPTLDGKVVIVDRESATLVRDVVISSEQFFNNVIFLDVVADRMVVATSKRVISINPNATVFLDADVKDVIVLENRVFVFTKDGRVMLADADLNVLKERKFPFAVFSGVMHGEFVYVVEKGGYLIATDLDLTTVNVYKLPDEINAPTFVTHKTVFVDNRSFTLNHQ
ncbi:PQQ-binding-like beta-propeller repeat protein [Sulfurospirillum sp. T05]|uniref:PQQ-binding-like beta-propeller repeat protein n=1 Tax=Sulfurospirillum tamanense TaxID=2813362 RepID=A0ABS2WPW9_9BACT|nr:PQQ-binding-like beta-propeller repeat protein [Sulfurospirillum tamanensis]MBN2963643.1 PQQ-binding-like beta-propeller repeat protein [Sulfurospirillum tamanensis]